jgi:hypothetical protein
MGAHGASWSGKGLPLVAGLDNGVDLATHLFDGLDGRSCPLSPYDNWREFTKLATARPSYWAYSARHTCSSALHEMCALIEPGLRLFHRSPGLKGDAPDWHSSHGQAVLDRS